MSVISIVLVLFLALFLVVGLVKSSLMKDVSGLKLMLLGINITLFGGIIAVDPNASLGGFEYIIVVIGLIVSFVGLGKKD
ncbi:MAG: hypothetical protein Q8936_20900 [Bacillota bacterium]|nr:hypothetical protein [Bacillota bacterium]